uniref:Uncharacterized protein n=1 Tax=Anopheles atroparvus TaxID=41427 RepID=A0AAG5DIV6_ANOAO
MTTSLPRRVFHLACAFHCCLPQHRISGRSPSHPLPAESLLRRKRTPRNNLYSARAARIHSEYTLLFYASFSVCLGGL